MSSPGNGAGGGTGKATNWGGPGGMIGMMPGETGRTAPGVGQAGPRRAPAQSGELTEAQWKNPAANQLMPITDPNGPQPRGPVSARNANQYDPNAPMPITDPNGPNPNQPGPRNPARPNQPNPNNQIQNPNGPTVWDQSSDAYDSALQMTRRAGSYDPSDVSAHGYQAATIGNTNLNQYMNPFTKNVINNSLNTMDKQRKMALNQLGASAGSAGAFGGARQGLVEATTNREFGEAAGNMASNLNMQNFQNAQGMAGTDAASRNAARSQLSSQRYGSDQANQNAGLTANGQKLAAAGQMGQLSGQGFDYGRNLANDQWQQGMAQQQLNQQIMNQGKDLFSGQTGQMDQGLQRLMAALGGGQFPSSQSTTSGQKNGLLDYIGAFASMLG